jgi:hypothetical protein
MKLNSLKNKIKKRTKKTLESTDQTSEPDHETGITSYNLT